MNNYTESFWQIHKLVSSGGKSIIKKDIINDYITQTKKEELNQENCPICKKKDSVKFNGENNICVKCGSEIDCNLSFAQEWRYYGSSDSKSSNPTRVGMPTNKLLPKSSMGSTISNSYINSFEFNRIKQKQRWIGLDYKERSLLNIFSVIKSYAKRGGITNKIIEHAKVLYKKISETKISRGINRKALEAACIYESCKLHNVPRSIKEIAKIYNLDAKIMSKGYKKFKNIMKLSKDHINKTNVTNHIESAIPIHYIDRFCCNLEMNKEMKYKCKYAAIKAYELNIADENTPTSITAGSIFLISMVYNLGITKKQIKEASGGVSEVTISKCFKKLYKYRHLLLENWEIK